MDEKVKERAQRILEYVSPSQVESYELCPRRWYNRSILGVDPEERTEAQQRGLDVGEASETYYETGEIPENLKDGRKFEYTDLLLTILPHLGPRAESVTVEKWVRTDISGLPAVRGRYDFFDSAVLTRELGVEPMAMLADIKCRSSLKYAKTPEQLLDDCQLVSYVRPLMSHAITIKRPLSNYHAIAIRHVYGVTSGKPKAKPVTAVATLENTQKRWNKTTETVRKIAEWARQLPETADPLEPNTEACSKFPPNGCPHKARCGFTQDMLVNIRRSTKMAEPTNPASKALMERLKGILADAPIKKVEESEVLSPKVEEPAILPPDAPSRTQAAPEEKPKRGRPKKETKVTVSVEQEDGTQGPAIKPAETEKVDEAVTPGPVLYVGCVPTKGPKRTEIIHLEEWAQPIMEELAKEKEVADWRMIQYTSKGELAAKMRDCAKTLYGKTVVVLSKYSPVAEVFQEVMVPHASEIVVGV